MVDDLGSYRHPALHAAPDALRAISRLAGCLSVDSAAGERHIEHVYEKV